MRNNARDIFKKMFNKPVKAEPIKESPAPEVSYKSVGEFKGFEQYQNAHNQIQSAQSKAVAKRHKANKVGRKQRKVNQA